MGNSPSWCAICATVAALAFGGHDVRAQPAPVPAADEAFQRGREALKIGKYQEACAAFEESQKLDPQLTTQFNIALCDEQLGKLASALAIYEELAAKDDNPQRRAKAIDMVPQLSARAARLRIEIAENRRGKDVRVPPGLEVTVNGVHAVNFKDMPIDLGTSRVVAHAPGYLEWVGQVSAKDEKQRVVVTITLDRDPAAPAVAPPPPPHEPPPPPPPAGSPGSGRRTAGKVMVIGGGVVLAGGIAAGVLARGKWNEAKDVCGGTTCETPADLARGQDLTDAARLRGNLSTALVIGGGVLVAGGLVLWLTAPSGERSVAVAPSASPTSMGVSLSGAF